MIPYHNIDPVIASFGVLKISYYSLSYVIGILFGWYYSKLLAHKFQLAISGQQIEDFITWIIISIIIGGRLGHVFFYDAEAYLANPIEILKTYEGGMSFHGAILGVLIASILYSKSCRIPLYIITDLISTVGPFGIMLGRFANFINGELYGRFTNVPWGMIFPDSPEFPRHPSQIYEALSEGLLIFIIMNITAFKFGAFQKNYFQTGLFLILYAIARSICEIFREPDDMFWFFTEGQLLSIPMIILGICLLKRKSGN
jgi:phosphatidylglycerol:prolipoprotein diacylglycerol transferase